MKPKNMKTATNDCLEIDPVTRCGSTTDNLIELYVRRPKDVQRSIKALYDELSTFEDFERPCNFVLDMLPGLTTVFQYSNLRCLHLDILEPLGDRLLTISGNSYTKDIIGCSSFQYHTLGHGFKRLPKMMYDRVVSSETHKFRGYPLLDQAIDSLRIGGKLYLFGLELRDPRMLSVGSSERVTEYIRIS